VLIAEHEDAPARAKVQSLVSLEQTEPPLAAEKVEKGFSSFLVPTL
jgi:hypothetical protein